MQAEALSHCNTHTFPSVGRIRRHGVCKILVKRSKFLVEITGVAWDVARKYSYYKYLPWASNRASGDRGIFSAVFDKTRGERLGEGDPMDGLRDEPRVTLKPLLVATVDAGSGPNVIHTRQSIPSRQHLSAIN